MDKYLNKSNFNINMEKIKNIKHKTELINQEYNHNIEKLNVCEKDIEYLMKKSNLLDQKLDRLIHNYK
jgi:hypothetical protein